jgi:hypothetical protein
MEVITQPEKLEDGFYFVSNCKDGVKSHKENNNRSMCANVIGNMIHTPKDDQYTSLGTFNYYIKDEEPKCLKK